MKNRTGFYANNKHGIVLASFAIAVATTLAITQRLTLDRIVANEQERIQSTLADLLPADLYDHPLQQHAIKLFDEQSQTTRTIYIAKKNGISSATIITAVAPDGYSGNIEMLVGILADGTLSDVRVTKHTETPGLGDAIELQRSDWILGFKGKNLSTPVESRWAVKKHGGEFDQFTGATITPRAVINEVKNTLHFFESTKQQIFQ